MSLILLMVLILNGCGSGEDKDSTDSITFISESEIHFKESERETFKFQLKAESKLSSKLKFQLKGEKDGKFFTLNGSILSFDNYYSNRGEKKSIYEIDVVASVDEVNIVNNNNTTNIHKTSSIVSERQSITIIFGEKPTVTPTPTVTATPTVTVSSGDTDVSSPIENYNGDFITKDGITLKFNFNFPTNTVFLNSKDLQFDPKGFKATKEEGTDVTKDIEVEITYNDNSVSNYDKSKEGKYVFKYLFEGNTITEHTFEIVKKVEPTPSLIKLKKTGQTTSYEQFDDGAYQIGITPRYSRSGDIVTDNITGLIWQDNEDAKTVRKNWDNAKSYCSDFTLGGKSDWRLPNIDELHTLGVEGKYNPAIDDIFVNVTSSTDDIFIRVISSGYWSLTMDASDSSGAWLVYFDSGFDDRYGKTYEFSVRCVRGGE